MTTKLHIDISHGLIDIEGDADLVREIYADFRTSLLSGVGSTQAPGAESAGEPDGAAHSENGAAAAWQLDRSRGDLIDSAQNGGGVIAPLPTWTTSSVNAISINFRRHNYRRVSLKRYLNL